MGMMIGSSTSNTRRVIIKDINGNPVASVSQSKSTSSQKKKKRLMYNFTGMSAQIMQAKTSGSASMVAARAKREVALLQRNLKNEEYDEDEVKNAISHAQSIERVASKRVKHLKQEEALKNNGNPYLSEMEDAVEDFSAAKMNAEEMLKLSEEELKKLMRELQESMKELEAEAKASEDQVSVHEEEDSLSEVVQENLDALDLEQLRKKHRSDELREIMEANMRYLRALFDKLAKEKQSAAGNAGSFASTEGVALELSGVEIPVQATEVPVAVEGMNMDITV